MNRLLLCFIITSALIIGCTDKPQQNTPPTAVAPVAAAADTNQLVYADKSQSSLRIFKDGDGWMSKSTEINYKIQSFAGNPFGKPFNDAGLGHDLEYYLLKYHTTTTAKQGSEKTDKTIAVEILPLKAPNHIPFTIRQNCDAVILEPDHYKTIIYGCGGGEDAIFYFDYQRNMIVQGDAKIVQATIPNSDIKLYIGFKNQYEDSSYIGTLFFGYNGIDKYQVKIRSNASLPAKSDYHAPSISIVTKNSRDKFTADNDEYTLWSLEKITDRTAVNITVKVIFECTAYPKKTEIEIPVINGKPFGKDEKMQNYSL